MDSEKRSNYDRFGHEGVSSAFGKQGFTWQDFTRAQDVSDIFGDLSGLFGGSSIFDMFFGGAGGRRSRTVIRRGSDIRVKVQLGLNEIAKGARKKIKLKRYESCSVCGGSGAKHGSTPETCPTCGGSGQMRRVANSPFGQVVNVTPCSHCGGNGRIVKDPCTACSGEGRAKKEKTINVTIPAGVASGNYIPMQGEGNAGRNRAPAGDLIVIVQEKEHPVFARSGDHLLCQVPVSYSTLALGGKVKVPTLNGKASLTVPAGTQSGKVFRLRGRGLPRLSGYGKGDELIELFVWTPARVSQKEKKLLKELDEVREEDLPPPGKYTLEV
jgi:molecular chaperone DnaJ